jgi:hypothetical protein
MTVTFHHARLGDKKRSAVKKFVHQVSQGVNFLENPKASVGPDGQIIVQCEFRGYTPARESKMRNVMAKASQYILESENVWVVGVPQKGSSPKKGRVKSGPNPPSMSTM